VQSHLERLDSSCSPRAGLPPRATAMPAV
jgi:hypothetical protein